MWARSLIFVLLVACNRDEGPYRVGGTVSGLEGTGLVLTLNGDTTVSPTEDGPFRFATELDEGATYEVEVTAQPASPGQACTVTGGSGTIGTQNVTTVSVTCVTGSGMVAGTAEGIIEGELVLQLNGGQDLVLTDDGAFTFPEPVREGGAFDVTVVRAPPGEECTVTGDGDALPAGGVADVVVDCRCGPYTGLTADQEVHTHFTVNDLGQIVYVTGFASDDGTEPETLKLRCGAHVKSMLVRGAEAPDFTDPVDPDTADTDVPIATIEGFGLRNVVTANGTLYYTVETDGTSIGFEAPNALYTGTVRAPAPVQLLESADALGTIAQVAAISTFLEANDAGQLATVVMNREVTTGQHDHIARYTPGTGWERLVGRGDTVQVGEETFTACELALPQIDPTGAVVTAFAPPRESDPDRCENDDEHDLVAVYRSATDVEVVAAAGATYRTGEVFGTENLPFSPPSIDGSGNVYFVAELCLQEGETITCGEDEGTGQLGAWDRVVLLRWNAADGTYTEIARIGNSLATGVVIDGFHRSRWEATASGKVAFKAGTVASAEDIGCGQPCGDGNSLVLWDGAALVEVARAGQTMDGVVLEETDFFAVADDGTVFFRNGGTDEVQGETPGPYTLFCWTPDGGGRKVLSEGDALAGGLVTEVSVGEIAIARQLNDRGLFGFVAVIDMGDTNETRMFVTECPP